MEGSKEIGSTAVLKIRFDCIKTMLNIDTEIRSLFVV